MSHNIGIAIFRLDDGRKPEERLRITAERYWGTGGSSGACGSGGAGAFSGGIGDCPPAPGGVCSRIDSLCPGSEDSVSSLWTVARTAQGKPYFVNQPDLFFSISHSGPFWACAMAGIPVGLDLQKHSIRGQESREEAAARYSRMAARFFHPAEAAYVQDPVSKDCFRRFFRIWTARESYVKYTGQGIDKKFGQLCVIPETGLPSAGPSNTETPSTVRAPQSGLTETGPLNFRAARQPRRGRQQFLTWQAENAFFLETEFPEAFSLCVCTGKQAEAVLFRA